MKLIASLIVITLSIQLQAADESIIEYKDWAANKIESHKVTDQSACVALTTEEDKDTTLEVYAEAGKVDGYVQPVVQIVTTEMDPALGVMASVDGIRMPMTIALKETKEVEIEVLEEGSSIPVVKKVEQQVFLGKFADKERMIALLRAKNRVVATFYDATGELGEAQFSLRGSSRTIRTMMDSCFE